MNPPSSTPVIERPWGGTVPHGLPDHSTYDLESSPDLEQEAFDTGIYVCHLCGKQCTRHCDLNKHLKTHSRPFKCPIEDCRYHTFGWPTEKELERHYNDKHSTAPKTYSCWYRPCTYTSKRESNCKQHMEKAHGWEYVRSRTGNKEDGPDTKESASTGESSLVSAYSRNNLALQSVPDFLLTPSPLEQCLPTPQDISIPIGFSGTISFGSDVYDQWTSPVSRLGNNDDLLGELSQAYAPKSPVPGQDDEWLRVPVDPRLYNITPSGTQAVVKAAQALPVAPTRDDMLKMLPTIVTPKTSPVAMSQVLTPTSEPSPVHIPLVAFKEEAITPSDAEHNTAIGQAVAHGSFSSGNNTIQYSYLGKRRVRFSPEPEDDSDEDDEPPSKRNKTPGGDSKELGDPKMICPFRAANPEIYNSKVDEKYTSCHTEHHNISTVVRHLGRPAHNLKVDNARSAISSFNVRDNEHGHPVAGLCKKCWTNFNDRQAFENHTRTECRTRSRSKREKYQLIQATFCVTSGEQQNRDNSSDEGEAEDVEDAEGEADMAVSPSATSSRSQFHNEDTISRREFLNLVQRVAELEQMLATRVPRSTPRTMPPQQQTVARAFSSSPALPGSRSSQFFGSYTFDAGQVPSRAAPGGDHSQNVAVGSLASQLVDHGEQARLYNNNQRVVPSFRSNGSDNMPTAQRCESSSIVRGVVPSQQQQPSGNLDGRSVEVPAYGGATSVLNTRTVGEATLHLSGNQVGGFGTERMTQESTNTAMRNQWEQAVHVGDDILGRNMDFFNNSGDEISKFLNMDSQ